MSERPRATDIPELALSLGAVTGKVYLSGWHSFDYWARLNHPLWAMVHSQAARMESPQHDTADKLRAVSELDLARFLAGALLRQNIELQKKLVEHEGNTARQFFRPESPPIPPTEQNHG